MIKFSHSFRRMCEKEGITFKQVSDLSGIHESTIRQYANDITSPGFDNLVKIFSVPQLSKYRYTFLSSGGGSPMDEMVEIIEQLTAKGRAQEATALLRECQNEWQAREDEDTKKRYPKDSDN